MSTERQSRSLVRPGLRHRPIRYAIVSAGAGCVGLPVLGLLHGVLHWPGGLAAFAAAGIGAIPSFGWNRSWVWERGRGGGVSGFVPFFLVTMASAAAASVGGAMGEQSGFGTPAVMFGALFGIGVLWVVRYFLLDRIFADFRP